MLTLNTYLLIYWERISHVDFEKICKKDCFNFYFKQKDRNYTMQWVGKTYFNNLSGYDA